MKKRLITLLGLPLGGLLLSLATLPVGVRGQGPASLPPDIGPGQGGAVLRQPGMMNPSTPSQGQRAVQDWWSNPYGGGGPNSKPRDSATGLLLPNDGPDPNQDIAVTPAQGPWLICVNSYTGPEAAPMARGMVIELRTQYQMPAFVFSHGREERRKEFERVRAIIEKQRNYLKDNNLPVDIPIRAKYQRIPEQYAVLVGGYRDQETARRALDQIRKLTPPDPNKVKLAKKFYVKEDPNTGAPFEGEQVWVNPFLRAFVVPNPTVKHDRTAEANQLDLDTLRCLNAHEPYSLLKCPKPITLAIKQFQTPTMMQAQGSSNGFLNALGLGGKGHNKVDSAAVSAHNLAELLRKAKLDAYVLHTRFTSVVTVGAFDSPDEPALKATQHLLATRLKLDPIQLFPQPIPMKVPRDQ